VRVVGFDFWLTKGLKPSHSILDILLKRVKSTLISKMYAVSIVVILVWAILVAMIKVLS